MQHYLYYRICAPSSSYQSDLISLCDCSEFFLLILQQQQKKSRYIRSSLHKFAEPKHIKDLLTSTNVQIIYSERKFHLFIQSQILTKFFCYSIQSLFSEVEKSNLKIVLVSQRNI